MSPTSTAVPSTFEEFVAERNITINLDAWRVVYDRDALVESLAPTTIPPCPSWCTSPAGHDYDSTNGYGPGDVTFLREHLGWAAPHVQVDATERNQDGTVTVDAPTAFVNIEDDLDAAAVRAFAAELLEAADVLDRLSL